MVGKKTRFKACGQYPYRMPFANGNSLADGVESPPDIVTTYPETIHQQLRLKLRTVPQKTDPVGINVCTTFLNQYSQN